MSPDRAPGRSLAVVRPATTVALALLLAAIFVAALVQFLVLGKG